MESVVLAILAKDKSHTLPFFLRSIYNQTFPKQSIHLYIRTNDNTDETATILKEFIEKYGKEYKSVFFSEESVSKKLKQWAQHEWNKERFKILGKLRQESIDYAKHHNSHYFVVDCDNFIVPETLQNMYDNRFYGIIAPMLQSTTLYSNFHYVVDAKGYHISKNPTYLKLYKREICDITSVKVVHCTYFVKNNLLEEISYDDGSERHEYVIFSDVLRKKDIEQYLDNRMQYGFLTMLETKEDFEKEIKDTWQNMLTNFHKESCPIVPILKKTNTRSYKSVHFDVDQ